MSLFNELKRRNVFRVGIAYLVAAWVLAQVADFVFEVVGAPEGALRALVVILVIGLIPTVIFAWAYEMTPEGVKKASEIDPDQSITHHTGRKLDIVTIVLVIAAVGFVVADRLMPGSEGARTVESETVAEVATPSVTADNTIPAEPALPATSIAVLPFANRSNQDDDLYFTDGIHDDLLTQLAKIGGLTVISRTSVMKYRDSTQTLGEIGMELKVGAIIEGGVQRVGDRVRINAQLIEVANDTHLWAETFDRELTAENVFDLQSEIARKIVDAIAIQLSPEEEELLDKIPTRNLAAYETYLRAREVLYNANYTRSSERAAQPLLEKAIELDPEYSDAYALLSITYGQDYWRGIRTSPEFVELYRSTIDRALALSPGSPMALRSQANYYYRVENDYQRSLELLQSALASAPGDVDIHGDMGLSLRRLGRWQESIASFERALAIDPENDFYFLMMLETLASNRQWQDIVERTDSLEDANPDELDSQLLRAQALFSLNGDLEQFERVFTRMNLVASNQYTSLATYIHWLNRDPDRVLEILSSPLMQQASEQSLSDKISNTIRFAGAWELKGDQVQANAYYEEVLSHRDEIEAAPGQVRLNGSLGLAYALARLDRHDDAAEVMSQLYEEFTLETDALMWNSLPCSNAGIRGLAGDRDGAIADLKICLKTSGVSTVTAWDLYYDPDWDFMRDDPRFVELATPDNLIQ